jgi:hypothetical protein
MTPQELERRLRELLGGTLPDAQLREELEKLATTEPSFSGFTWLYGPELYRRNRRLFRPFILSRFSTFMIVANGKWKSIQWRDHREALDRWFREVDSNDEPDLFRRLYEWKLSDHFDWRKRDARSEVIRKDLLARFKGAQTPARRQIELRKFDLWYQLDEASACELYSIDPAATPSYILRRLRTGWFSEKRELWSDLLKAADDQRDEDFRWKLYRRQVPLNTWQEECLHLCSSIRDPEMLVRELERRHPEGYAKNLSETFYRIVERRGRDVFPYVMRHLRDVWGGWFSRGSYGKMADYAREKGWWDLWAALIRVCSQAKEFNKEVMALLEDKRLPENEIVQRLGMLAGVSREWNWPGFGFASVHQLEEPVALMFYARFPDLLRTTYRQHLQSHLWGPTYPELLRRFIEAGDEDMVDMLASRLVTRFGKWGNGLQLLAEANKLAEYYAALKNDETTFSRRAANVLSRVPAYTIHSYNTLIRENGLARLLFERSASSYLADAKSLADLVEASEIHVMSLAYRALGLNDSRAREQASYHLPLLLGTLLRPLQRGTRTLAFGALANAANTLDNAKLILERCRDALTLPDVKYPKEKLLGLIGQVLHRWPELRGPKEEPVIYERAA